MRAFSNFFPVTGQDKVASPPVLAVDAAPGSVRGRLYVVTNEPGHPHLSIEEEKGGRWRETVTAETNAPGEVYHHGNPVVAVNNRRVVVVAWPEHLGTTDANRTHIDLASSVDGGNNFLAKPASRYCGRPMRWSRSM